MAVGRGRVSSVEQAMRNDVEGFRANNRLNRIADYVARGRCHKNLSEPALNQVWIEAYRQMATHPDDLDKLRVVNDLDAEFELRVRMPPYLCVTEYQDRYVAAIAEAFANMTDEERAAANRALQRDIDDFKSQRDKSKN
jgi:hypothetical protein